MLLGKELKDGLTAEDYRSAAKVLEADYIGRMDGDGYSEIHIPTTLENLRTNAEILENRNEYAEQLGSMSVTKAAFPRGVDIIKKLLEDGWTTPEGLL